MLTVDGTGILNASGLKHIRVSYLRISVAAIVFVYKHGSVLHTSITIVVIEGIGT